MYNKNWKKVEEHVATRTGTQARSHAQKFFANILRKNMTMEQFLHNLSLETLINIKNSVLANLEQGDSLIDGEAEIDKLLMMHMTKSHHDNEVSSSSPSKVLFS